MSCLLARSCLTSKDGTSSANENEPFTVYLFDVRGINVGTINFASLFDGLFIAEKMGRGQRHQSMAGLCTLARRYNIPIRERLR